jgi:hypothetical protein
LFFQVIYGGEQSIRLVSVLESHDDKLMHLSSPT